MTHLQVDPPSFLKTPPPGGTLPLPLIRDRLDAVHRKSTCRHRTGQQDAATRYLCGRQFCPYPSRARTQSRDRLR